MNGYLRSFVIGSSFPVFVLWFISVSQVTNKTYSYELYSILNPLYFGLMNMLAYHLGKIYDWSLRKRLFIISIVSAAFVSTLTITNNPYGYKTIKQYVTYVEHILLWHFITYNVIIYWLEKHVS